MAIVHPFKAIRPTRDKVNLVASRSYLSYSDETLKEKLEHNPFTFLHIINTDYKDKIKLKGIEKFKIVKNKFNEFIDKKYLIQDKKEFLSKWRDVNKLVFDIVKNLDGSFSAEHGIGKLKKEELKTYNPEIEINLMKSIKSTFDPKNILNPGKVL